MSYTNETTHYSIPKPLGTDLTVPMDYNDAADAIDQALFDASTNASEAVTAAANAVDAAADAVEEVGSLGTEVNNLKGRTSALETSDVIQNNKIDALENQGVTKFDSAGVANPYVNGLTYSVGDVVTYNGQRYKCTTAVVAVEPFDADKWSAEDVETVLNEIKSDLANAKLLHTITPTTSETWSSVITRVATYLRDNFVEADMPKIVINFDNSFYKVSGFKSTSITFGNVTGYGQGVAISGGVSNFSTGTLNSVIINGSGAISVYTNTDTAYSCGDIKIYRV